jgi:hypothetical protein
MPRRSRPESTRLDIYADGDSAPLPSSSERYQLVEVLVESALSLLETAEGRDSLVQVAQSIIRARSSIDPPVAHLYVGRAAERSLSYWIDHFLNIMRRNFPIIELQKTHFDAMAFRKGGTNNMANFDPRTMGHMVLNIRLLSQMLYHRRLRQSEDPEEQAARGYADVNYSRFKFQIIITIAHELVHFLTAFLTGEESHQFGTPETVCLDGYGMPPFGEAGRYWEKILLGGVVEYYQVERVPSNIKSKQAGEPYLLANGLSSAEAKPISMSYI